MFVFYMHHFLQSIVSDMGLYCLGQTDRSGAYASSAYVTFKDAYAQETSVFLSVSLNIK